MVKFSGHELQRRLYFVIRIRCHFNASVCQVQISLTVSVYRVSVPGQGVGHYTQWKMYRIAGGNVIRSWIIMTAWVCTSGLVLLETSEWSCAGRRQLRRNVRAAGRRQLSAHVAAVNLITIGGQHRAGVARASMARSCCAWWVVNQQTVTNLWTAGATYMTDRP